MTMRRFRFPLQRLLKLRGQLELAARRHLAGEIRRVQDLETQLQHLDQNLEACRASGLEGSLALARALEQGLMAGKRRCKVQLGQTQQRMEQARQSYLQRRQDHMVLERLRQGRMQEWQTAAESESAAQWDEVAQVRFQRRLRQSREAGS